jgi:LacI family sucrose operon transcriptional repressor
MKSIIDFSQKRPTAVFAVTDRLAIGAMQYLKKIGLSIPDDIAVAGMGASELSRYISPSLTTIDFSLEDAGREAATLLVENINGGNYHEVIRTIKYRLLERDSI